jgi:hypothetical protein
MKLLEVIFWGSEGDAPNKNTIYLVGAPDFQTAVGEVSCNLPAPSQSCWQFYML